MKWVGVPITPLCTTARKEIVYADMLMFASAALGLKSMV